MHIHICVDEMTGWTHAAVWRPLCVRVCAVEQSGEMDVRAGVAALRVRCMCGRDGGGDALVPLGVFQRSSPWCGSAPVVVCTRVLSAELDRCLLKSV